MAFQSVAFLGSLVFWLGLTTLSTAVTIFLLMEIRFRRQLALQVRRLMLTSRLSPTPDEQNPQVHWSESGRKDREIIVDILIDQSRSQDARGRRGLSQLILVLGVYDRWLQELRSRSESRRVRAATRLGYFHDPRGVPALVEAAQDPSRYVRLAVVLALSRLKDPEGVRGLIYVAQNPVRVAPDLTLAAGLAACAEAQPSLLIDLLKSPEARLRMVASWALSEIADQAALPQLQSTACDPDPEVRAKAARALARIHAPDSIEALNRLAKDPVGFVRVRALDALGGLGDPTGEETILHGLEDPIREVRYRAAFALRQIRGMKGEIATKVLGACSRRGFNSLISEWDRAGFLWDVVSGLSARDWLRFLESRETVRVLIGAGVTRALLNFILVFPDIKVQLRLVRLFLESSPDIFKFDLIAVAKRPGCDRRVAARISQAYLDDTEASVAGNTATAIS